MPNELLALVVMMTTTIELASPVPQTVSPEEAALAVRTAATAITFLATRLP